MVVKDIFYEDFCNYKEPAMFVLFPNCTFKCERECGKEMCQNSCMTKLPSIDISTVDVVKKYLSNPITHALVCGGLEPFDSSYDLLDLVTEFRKESEDTIVIYTGYKPEEIERQLDQLRKFPNIIVKFGRFVPDEEPHFDSLLGVNLASSNQYAERIS
jgi:hypothetical protein